MNSKKLLWAIMLYTMIPLTIMSAISALHLYYVSRVEKLADIKQLNVSNEEYLKDKANIALVTADYYPFQEKIDSIVTKNDSAIVSIELINKDQKIVAMSPNNIKDIPLEKNGHKVFLYNQASISDHFTFEHSSDLIDDQALIGYMIIRYNDIYINKANDNALDLVFSLLALTLLLSGIVYYHMHKYILKPYHAFERYLIKIIDDDIYHLEIKHNNDQSPCHLLDQIIDNNLSNQSMIDLLKNKLIKEKNELNETRKNQFEMTNELVSGLQCPVNTSRRLLSKLIRLDDKNKYKQDYYLFSGLLDEMASLINSAKNMIDNPYADYKVEAMLISDFYKNINNLQIDSSFNLHSGNNIKEELLNFYIAVDYLQIQLLLERILKLAVYVSNRKDIYINLMIREINDDTVRILLEIQDSSSGMSREETENVNLYLNTTEATINTHYYKKDDLKAVNHLKRIPGLSIHISSEKDHGNYYRISLSCEYSHNLQDILNQENSSLVHAIILKEDKESNTLEEYYRVLGIDMSYFQFIKYNSMDEHIINYDVILIDFTMNHAKGLFICSQIRKNNENIIGIINHISSNDDRLLNELYDSGVKDIIQYPYNPDKLSEKINKIATKIDYVKSYIKSIS